MTIAAGKLLSMFTRRTLLSGLQSACSGCCRGHRLPSLRRFRRRSPSSAHASAVLTIEGLGKGVAPLDGPWQFHLGDDPAWAAPGIDDATGHNGWEQLTAASPWGTQGHPSYTGYAWYRRQINITPAPGASPDVTLLIPAIDDVYELFWNGVSIGHLGTFPPRLDWQVRYRRRSTAWARAQRSARGAGLQTSADVDR